MLRCDPSLRVPDFSSNSYAFSETSFHDSPPDTASVNPFLAMMLTANDLIQAKLTVDQGVASDGTFPVAPVYLAKTSDLGRSSRYVLFDDAIFDARVQGNATLVLTNQDSPYGLTGLLGYQTGLADFNILPDTFVPGAMADSFTSFGGIILVPNGQTTVLAFLSAGAAGSYGTVTEPDIIIGKFPSPRDYFYQGRGFSLAESYYQSIENPYQGLLVGEPLAAPFACRASGSWNNLPTGAVLGGRTNLLLQFTATDNSRPLQQVDLFLDGALLQTLTNIPPTAGNLFSISLNGVVANYTAPANATLTSLAAGLVDAINSVSNASQVTASPFGDRITLRSTDPTKTGDQVSLFITNSAPTGAFPTTLVRASRTTFLDSTAFAFTSFNLTNTALMPGDWLQLELIKTNGTGVTLWITNTDPAGTMLELAQSLADQVNSNADLLAPDGVSAEINPTAYADAFTLQAQAPGLGPSQIQAILSSSSTNSYVPPTTNSLEANLSDVQPRNHLYITCGITNLVVAYQLDTTTLADGQHELTAVAYEGSHVRTQTAITQSVVISNSPLGATFASLVGDTNAALEGTLVFSVSVNTNSVLSIELFSTGGSVGLVTNQAIATFSIVGTNLGAGLHPFYAIVTAAGGTRYQTETKWIRLVSGSEESPFPLSLAGNPPLLSWPAVADRRYDILSADNLVDGFQVRQTVLPTNDLGQWLDVAASKSNRFYRVRSSY